MEAKTILQRIDTLKQQIETLGPLTPEQQKAFDKKIELEFHYNTNHIEGNTLTYAETELLLVRAQVRGAHDVQEIDEMKASDVALELVYQEAMDSGRPLTENFIKNLNRILLVKPYWKEAITVDGLPTRKLIKVGDYKDTPNNVQLANGDFFEYESVANTPVKMEELIGWYREAEEAEILYHPVELAALLHYRFVRIHPFDDGNGRISRLLMNYVLYRHGLPTVVIKSEDKKAYLHALQDADVGNLESFVSYIAQQAVWSLELLLKAAKGERLEEEEDWRKKLSVLNKTLANKETLELTKTPEVILDLIQREVATFSLDLAGELSVYQDFFRNIVIEFGSERQTFNINLLDEIVVANVKELWQDELILKYTLQHFKKNNADAFNVGIEFKWEFETFQYTFSYKSNRNELKTISKLYHQGFTEDEKKEIISQAGGLILYTIEYQLGIAEEQLAAKEKLKSLGKDLPAPGGR